MNKSQQSVNDLKLISPELLIAVISTIEVQLPGWWWSVSQEVKEISFNLGPGRNGPHDPDVKWAHTKEGDEGRRFRYIHAIFGSPENNLLKTLNQFIVSINNKRGLESGIVFNREEPVNETKYRYQTKDALTKLEVLYETLPFSLGIIRQNDYNTTEVYLGSCDFSVDCSLKGIKTNGSEFDITVDLTKKAELWESLDEAVNDLQLELAESVVVKHASNPLIKSNVPEEFFDLNQCSITYDSNVISLRCGDSDTAKKIYDWLESIQQRK